MLDSIVVNSSNNKIQLQEAINQKTGAKDETNGCCVSESVEDPDNT